MDKYRVAKLVELAGKLWTRKKLQKVVYLLKAAGCPFDADFTLHHYGPYSHDLARLTDDMVRSGLLEEEAAPNQAAGKSYSYNLSPRARRQLRELDEAPGRPAAIAEFEKFEGLAFQLLGEPVSRLEFAATIAYFKRPGRTWDEARAAAGKFKKLPPDGPEMGEAQRLAREVMEAGV